MAKWNYQIDGTHLRKAIDDGNIEAILDEIRYQCGVLYVKKVMEEFDFDDFIEGIMRLESDMYDGECIDDEVDCLLSDFYDFCDMSRVWITL